MDDKPIMATLTGEYFQPVRLHYQVADHQGLLAAFKKIRCVQHDASQDRWVWLYEEEAKGQRFKNSYEQIAPNLRPIVLGSFFLRREDQLLLDLRSCERATMAILFFDRRIPRKVAKVTECEVINRLFPADENPKIMPHDLFDRQQTTPIDPDAEMQELVDSVAHLDDPQEKLRVALEEMNARSKRPLPEIERFPIHFYEDGIQGFESTLRVRQMVAYQHWLGNSEYSMHDVIQEMVTR
jgi:hypothetical protein